MLPAERITAYFAACSEESPAGIARHFTDDAVVYDTNVRPMIGSEAIGAAWVKVRERWQGAVWTVDSVMTDGNVAAIEWSMTGTNPADDQPFVFHGSEHYTFRYSLIAEIRQYWTFDPGTLDTGLIGFDYGSSGA